MKTRVSWQGESLPQAGYPSTLMGFYTKCQTANFFYLGSDPVSLLKRYIWVISKHISIFYFFPHIFSFTIESPAFIEISIRRVNWMSNFHVKDCPCRRRGRATGATSSLQTGVCRNDILLSKLSRNCFVESSLISPQSIPLLIYLPPHLCAVAHRCGEEDNK